jgi:hypothetical protein
MQNIEQATAKIMRLWDAARAKDNKGIKTRNGKVLV